MLVQILALGSALALGSSLVQGRQARSLRYKLSTRQDQQRTPGRMPGMGHRSFAGGRYGSPRRRGDLYRDAKKGVLAIRKVLVISLGGAQERDAQLNRLQGGHAAASADRSLDRRIYIAIGLIGVSAAGSLFYAPLLPLAGAGTLVNNLPVFRQLSENLQQGRITTELLEIVSQISFIFSGYYFLATLVSFTALLDIKLLRRTELHSHQQLIDRFSQKPQTVWVVVDGVEMQRPLEAIGKNDRVVVNAGEVIPVDGTVVEGIASIDQHSLTGESQPVERETGASVFATTLVLSGRIQVQAEHTGADTNAAKIERILEQTQDFKENLRLRGKRIADGFIAPTLFVSSLTLPLFGASSALAVLWTGFGYDMKLYGPISVLNFLHIMAKNGILIKDGRSLELLRQLDTVVFDKTGTLTVEQPRLGRIYPLANLDEQTLLAYAAAAEHRQGHPIAKAILSAAEGQGLQLPEIEDAAYQVGYGIQVSLQGKRIQVGSLRFMQQHDIELPAVVAVLQGQAHERGGSLVYVAVDGALAGVLQLDPCVRPEAKHIVDYLKSRDIAVCIISGDNLGPTRRLAEELGVDSYYAETLPAQKAELIAELRADGKTVGYVGDGINDAIALKEANVSISLSGASHVATDAAQIILMDGDLARIESLFEISQAFEKNMQVNFLNSMIPGAIILSGVFMFQLGVVGALAIYFSSEIIGLANCMMPLVKDELAADGGEWKAGNDSADDGGTESGLSPHRT